jgi:capsular exopolysaccharide synthesis family protein
MNLPELSQFALEAQNGLPPALSPSLVWHPQCPPRTAEQFRRIAHSLYRLRVERQARVVGITSALPEEGKTLTAVNIAVSLAEAYRQRVLLVDADLRRPTVARVIGLGLGDPGLSDWLARQDDVECPMVRVSSRLSVVTSGKAQPDPLALLASLRMALLMASARADFEWVIVDTPPVGLLVDAGVLDGSLDGYVMVVAAGKTTFPAARRALDTLGRDRLLGTVLNRLADGSRVQDPYAAYYEATASPRRNGS